MTDEKRRQLAIKILGQERYDEVQAQIAHHEEEQPLYDAISNLKKQKK